jgi:hypothetical protein
MKVSETITRIKDSLQAELPALLEEAGAGPIAYYGAGYAFNQDDTACCVRLASLSFLENFEFAVHLSLPHIQETEAYLYMDALVKFLNEKFDTNDYGYTVGRYTLDVFETDFNHGDVQALFMVTMDKAADDCDIG